MKFGHLTPAQRIEVRKYWDNKDINMLWHILKLYGVVKNCSTCQNNENLRKWMRWVVKEGVI